jgi:hypothetical protein
MISALGLRPWTIWRSASTPLALREFDVFQILLAGGDFEVEANGPNNWLVAPSSTWSR